MSICKKRLACLVSMSGLAVLASAQFTENFDVDNTANWTVNNGPTDGHADFFFDYSTYGIPSAPGSGGTTRGLRMMANLTNGVFGGLSVSPTGQSFTGDYKLSAQVWMNFLNTSAGSGNGTTQIGGLGIGTNGTTAQWPGNANSVYFMTTLDGGSATDWRAYSSAAQSGYAAGNAIFSAPSLNNSHSYYASYFTGGTVPAAQTTLFPTQRGTAPNGTLGFGWHEMVVEKAYGFATWSVDGLQIARIDLSTVNLSGSNILFNFSDTNAGISTDPNSFLNAMIVDNVSVTPVPEPATLAALGLGAAALLRRRRKS